ncbi:hypothetical protein NQ315_001770 [Exocentrus adspersus]|uniref:Cyclin N-terminal domain-containing protein n=1 Tax=Exocentrus adspersus TaxID=1586481 RepID=A0AAV8W997_9CUCU|nr:hypothetical protein NQ315_001770 [Exocentrus adspersus]
MFNENEIECFLETCAGNQPEIIIFEKNHRCHCSENNVTVCVPLFYQKGGQSKKKLNGKPCSDYSSYYYDSCTFCLCKPENMSLECYEITNCYRTDGGICSSDEVDDIFQQKCHKCSCTFTKFRKCKPVDECLSAKVLFLRAKPHNLAMKCNNFENELLADWVNQLRQEQGEYLEPVLCQQATKLIKLACITFNQDIHVFIMSIEVLEDYIRRKSLRNEEITETVLVIACTVFMSSKYMGDQDLKVQYIEKFLTKITGKEYGGNTVKRTEMEILRTLGNKLPITTRVDDLNTFVTKYERESMLKVSIRPLCLDILEALYLSRDKWFFDLKSVYVQNEEALKVYKSLMSSRFYLPIGILLYAFLHTNYEHFLCIHSIIDELTSKMHIHADHVSLLVSTIHEVIKTE